MLRGEPFLLASKIEATREKIIARIEAIKKESKPAEKKDEEIKDEKLEIKEVDIPKDDTNPQIGCLDSNSGDDNIVCE
jgi:hypothetical protein